MLPFEQRTQNKARLGYYPKQRRPDPGALQCFEIWGRPSRPVVQRKHGGSVEDGLVPMSSWEEDVSCPSPTSFPHLLETQDPRCAGAAGSCQLFWFYDAYTNGVGQLPEAGSGCLGGNRGLRNSLASVSVMELKTSFVFVGSEFLCLGCTSLSHCVTQPREGYDFSAQALRMDLHSDHECRHFSFPHFYYGRRCFKLP